MPTPGTDTSHAEIEYEQDVVKPGAQQKFEKRLNNRARDGWKVMHIAQTDMHFLVTYSRSIQRQMQHTHTTTISHGPQQLDEDLNKKIMQGFTLRHFSSALAPRSANHGLSDSVIYTCVWHRSRRV